MSNGASPPRGKERKIDRERDELIMQVKVKQRVRSDCKEIKVNECKQCNSGYGYIKTKSPKKPKKTSV